LGFHLHYASPFVERSEPADAWDEGGEGDDYPSAPIPAHERTWRHPSEIGQAAWVAAEPPVAIGRGLMVTTGAIGCVLGVAVLWLLTPMGSGLAPSASPIATSAVTAARILGATPTTAQAVLRPTDSTVETTIATLPAEDIPVNTVLVMNEQQVEPGSIAVAIGDAPFIVTTASAVSGSHDVSLMSSGESTGGVVTIQGDLALIEPSSSVEVVAFEAVAAAEQGQTLLVLTDEITEITYHDDGSSSLDAGVIVEGTPVVNDEGALVALCTLVIDDAGAHVNLLPLTGFDGSTAPTETTVAPETTVPATSPAEVGGGWLGVRFDTDGDAVLTIDAIAADSPAAIAGLLVGDRITAIDGIAVATVDDVLALITARSPGTVVTITVLSQAQPSGGEPVSATTTSTSTTAASTTVAPSTSIASTGTTPSAGAPLVERTVSVTLGAYEPTV
jgi:membrane-associated protease RseP (regulator of RpoE activity)